MASCVAVHSVHSQGVGTQEDPVTNLSLNLSTSESFWDACGFAKFLWLTKLWMPVTFIAFLFNWWDTLSILLVLSSSFELCEQYTQLSLEFFSMGRGPSWFSGHNLCSQISLSLSLSLSIYPISSIYRYRTKGVHSPACIKAQSNVNRSLQQKSKSLLRKW